MPLIDAFDGIKIYVYSRDHNPPHIHAFYAEYEVLIEIGTTNPMQGDMPRKQLKKVQEFVGANASELMTLFRQLNPKLR